MYRTMISIVAGAMTLGSIALSSADASVFYGDIDELSVTSASAFHWLDVDGNGTADIAFDWSYDSWIEDTCISALTPFGAPTANGFAANQGASLRLAGGDVIDGALTYVSDSAMLSDHYDEWEMEYARWGNWDGMAAEETAYLGFSFVGDDDQIRYGWVRAHVDPGTLFLTVYDYAYEGVPGEGIVAGDMGSPVPLPAGFMLFASGFAALMGWKRKACGEK
ncbi:MAG: hypothetical protein AB7E77_06830 [Desulfobulbus sp.]